MSHCIAVRVAIAGFDHGLLQWPVGGRRGQLQAPVASMIYPINGVSSTGSVVSASLAPVAFMVRRKLSKVPLQRCSTPVACKVRRGFRCWCCGLASSRAVCCRPRVQRFMVSFHNIISLSLMLLLRCCFTSGFASLAPLVTGGPALLSCLRIALFFRRTGCAMVHQVKVIPRAVTCHTIGRVS